MQVQNSTAVEIQEIPVHCPVCHEESNQKAFYCPGCKRFVVSLYGRSTQFLPEMWMQAH